MHRWIKNGGWVIILTLFIFLAYCTFYLVHTQTVNPKENLGISLELQGLPVSLSISPVYFSISQSEEIRPIGSNDIPYEPSGDSSEDIAPSVYDDSPEGGFDPPMLEPPGELSDDSDQLEETANAAEISDLDEKEESEIITFEDDETIYTDEYFGGDIFSDDYTDELTVLLQIRDTLYFFFCIACLLIAGFIVYLIFNPIWHILK